ncbi:MAG: translocation/assembly module TamB, partial [Treponema sp.]|nr:translocation/assembly module TamB [Treponema sp.]
MNRDQAAARNNHIITYLNIFFFVALAAGAAALFKPAEARLHTMLAGVRNDVIGMAEYALNRKISYGSMKTTLFNLLDIRNVTIGAEGGGEPLPLFSISRIRVSWSLMDMLALLMQNKTDSIGKAVHTVRIDKPVLTIDLAKDADIVKLLSGQKGAPLALKDALNENAALLINNGTVHATLKRGAKETPGSDAGDFTFEASGLRIDAGIKNNRLFFNGSGKAAAVSSKLDELFNRPMPVSSGLDISWSSNLDFTDIDANFTLASFSSPLFDTAPLRFILKRDHAALNLTSANERFPFDLSLETDFGAGSISASVIAEDFSPQSLVFLNGELQPYQKWLGVTVSGAVSCMMERDGTVRYEGRLSGSVPDSLPVGRVSFVVDGAGDADSIWLNALSVRTDWGSFGYGGRIDFAPFAPNGTLTVSGFTLSKTADAHTRLNIATRGRTALLSGASIELGSVSLVSPAASIYMGDKGLQWSLSADELTNRNSPEPAWEADAKANAAAEHDGTAADEGATPRKRIFMEGVYDYNPQNLDMTLAINGVTVADIVEMAGPFIALPGLSDQAAGIVHEVNLTTEIFITTDFTHFLYNAPEINLRRRNVQAQISLAGTERRIEVTEGRVDWGTGFLDGLFYADFMNMNNISFGGAVSYKNTSYNVEGMFRNGNTVHIQGSYGFNASIDLGGRALSGFIEADDVPVPIGETVSYVGFNSSFRFDSLDSWGVNILSLNVSNIATPASPSSTVRLSGTVDQDHADLPMILFNDGSALTGKASLLWDRGFSGISGVIAFQNENGEEQYYVELSCENMLGKSEGNPRYTAWLTGNGMRLAHFLEQDYNAVVSGNAHMDWESIDAFSTRVTIDSLDAVVSDSAVHLSGTAEADNEKVTLNGIQARYGGLQGDIPSFTADLDSVQLPRMLINGNFAGKIFTLECGIEAEYGRIASWRDIPHIMEAFDGKFIVNNARLDVLQSSESFAFDFSHKDGLISLFGGPSGMIRFQISDGGDFFADIAAPSPVRGSVAGVIANGDIDAFASDLYVDLTALWGLLPPQKDFIVSGGFVTASIEIRGPLAAPEFFGQAIGESVALQVPPYLKHPIRPVPITVDITGAEMTFGPTPASVGYGAGMVSGWFRLDRWIPNAFILDIAVPASTPVPFAFDIMGVVAHGDATGTLRLALEDNEFKTGGDLTAQDTVVTLNFEELENQPPLVDLNNPLSFVTDITVRSGRKLEFLWPTADFPIIQASADMGASLKIENDTSTGSLLLLGDIPLRAGEVFYFERSFYLQEGTLSFNENEVRFDPYISARAEIRDRADNEPVTISLIIDESPLSSFTTRLESNPALSQVEIFSLLGQNMTG